MRLKSLITAVALGVGLVGTGMTAAEATTAPRPAPSNPPKAAPGNLPPRAPGNLPPRAPGDLPKAAPGNLPILHENPNYTG